jgi:hypothetical protein
MSLPPRTSTDTPAPRPPRVALVVVNGSLAIVALWALMLALTGRDRSGLVLVLALLSVPIANAAVLLAARFFMRRR